MGDKSIESIKRRSFLRKILYASGGLLTGSSFYAYKSASLKISREKLVIRKIERNLRIVAVSDLHAPCFYSSSIDLVRIVNRESPDIFVLAGDTIDKHGNECFVEMFDGIEARFAKIATLGNWEYLGRIDMARFGREYDKVGISLLVNSTLEISGLTAIGLDDPLCGSPNYQILKCQVNRFSPLLVVSHCPASFDKMVSLANVPLLVLSGHTHGGQIAPFGVSFVTPPGSGSYVQGWYSKGKHSMYVMRGIGTTPGLPLRIGARPELLVLDVVGSRA